MWKQPRTPGGQFAPGKNPNIQPKPTNTGHGNSLNSDKQTTLYKLVNRDGSLSKWGITSEVPPTKRYTSTQLGDRRLVPMATGSRTDMSALERALTSRFGGPDNLERWANTITNKSSPKAIIEAFAKIRNINVL